jgi:hypothetical protein
MENKQSLGYDSKINTRKIHCIKRYRKGGGVGEVDFFFWGRHEHETNIWKKKKTHPLAPPQFQSSCTAFAMLKFTTISEKMLLNSPKAPMLNATSGQVGIVVE